MFVWHSGSGDNDFKNIVNIFALFRYYLPLKKSGTYTQRYLVQSLVKAGPVVLEKMKMWKVLNDNNNDDEHYWLSSRKAHLSLRLSWAKIFFTTTTTTTTTTTNLNPTCFVALFCYIRILQTFCDTFLISKVQPYDICL